MSAEPARNVGAEEVVTRFIYESQSVKGNHVRVATFLPMFDLEMQRLETSVCRLNLCNRERAWELARTLGLASRPGVTLHACADVSVGVANQNGLICEEAPVDGFPEHAVLIGWPEEKEKQKLIAMALVKASARHLPPATGS